MFDISFLFCIVYVFLLVILVIYWNQMRIARYLFKKYDILWENTNNEIILTFDDVPYDNRSFDKLLKVLEKHKVVATFFVISSFVNDDNIKLLTKAVYKGHHLANHGKTNKRHSSLTHTELHDEIFSCQKLITEIYNEANIPPPDIMYYRPGCGHVNKLINDYCVKNGYKIVLGTNYPCDPLVPLGFINKFYIERHLKQNDIIILHDRKWTPDMIDRLLKEKSINTKFTSLANQINTFC